jgi:hypothetical protein
MKAKMYLFAIAAGVVVFLSPSSSKGNQMLHGHVPEAVAYWHLQSIDRLPASTRLSLVIGLPLCNQEEFNNLLQQIYDPSVSRWLTFGVCFVGVTHTTRTILSERASL